MIHTRVSFCLLIKAGFLNNKDVMTEIQWKQEKMNKAEKEDKTKMFAQIDKNLPSAITISEIDLELKSEIN